MSVECCVMCVECCNGFVSPRSSVRERACIIMCECE